MLSGQKGDADLGKPMIAGLANLGNTCFLNALT
jgi:ubiquitin C-terminal hydrolase